MLERVSRIWFCVRIYQDLSRDAYNNDLSVFLRFATADQENTSQRLSASKIFAYILLYLNTAELRLLLEPGRD